jgi:subtilisin family serine protease
MPSSTAEELAAAILDTIHAGARVINVSVALVQASRGAEQQLEQALDFAAGQGVIVVAAAGNQGIVAGSAVTRHPWVIPVVACDLRGNPTEESNLGGSIGRRGLRAPGENITSLGTDGVARNISGTSAAAPFVTGTIALLWSVFPAAVAALVKLAVTQAGGQSRRSVVPPLLDARAAYKVLANAR